MATGNEEAESLTSESIKEDVASLSRVSHRLAMIDDAAQFESVVAKLLPKLLARMGKNHQQMQKSEYSPLKPQLQQVQSKLMEILSHVLKRVKQSTTSSSLKPRSDNTNNGDHGRAGPLPCQAILDLLVQRSSDGSYACQDVDALTKNLSLTFLSVGVPQTPDPSTLLPGLLVFLYEERKHQQLSNHANVASAASTLTLLILHTLMALSPPPMSSSSSTKTETSVSSFDDQEMVRLFLHRHEECAAILYELILDVLLWTPPKPVVGGTASTLPPEGLSQQSQQRLKSSVASPLWTKSLDTTKMALLDLIAPCRRAIFIGSKEGTNARNVARTITLMLVAKGNSITADSATTYFQMYMNSNGRPTRNKNRKKRLASDTLQRVDVADNEKDHTSTNNFLVASDEVILELVSLTVGQGQAESIATEHERLKKPNSILPLHCAFEECSTDSAILWSGKRRAVNLATTASVLWDALALQIVPLRQASDGSQLATGSRLIVVGMMLAFLGEKYLSSPQGASSAMSMIQAKPYLALAELLQALTVQVCKGGQSVEVEDLKLKFMRIVEEVLNRQVATSISAESRNTSMIMNSEGSWAVREECYAILSHLCRSSNGEGSIVSISTASLLFSCASKEHERLRPRSVACLDTLLEAFTRVFSTTPDSAHGHDAAIQSEAPSANPWAAMTNPGKPKAKSDTRTNKDDARNILSRALVPLLWNAAASHHPKASRVAAARWAHVLLKRNKLDVAKGCHLLCFLTGDQDVTVASLANQGLFEGMNTHSDDEGLPALLDLDKNDSNESSYAEMDFLKYTELVFQINRNEASSFPQYGDFSFAGKASSLKFGLYCLLADLYGGENTAVALYLDAMIKTLHYFLAEAKSAVPVRDRASTDLLDQCSICFLSLLRSSSFARVEVSRVDSVFLSQNLGLLELEELAVTARSSMARRHFAGAIGSLFEDPSLWKESNSMEHWLGNSGIGTMLERCVLQMGHIQKSHYQTGKLHGSIYLTGRVLRALRLKVVQCKDPNSSNSLSMSRIWEQCTVLLRFLGAGVLHHDEVLSNASVSAVGVALSFDSLDAPQLDINMVEGTALLLESISKAINKFTNGDAVEPFRTITLIKTAGSCLGATSVIDTTKDISELHKARSSCVAAVISTLGSLAFRKEEEVALVAGEALGMYADSCSFQSRRLPWPPEFDEDFSKNLSPHEFVYYILLAANLKASSPHKRTSTAPALLGLVGRAARLVHIDKRNQTRNFIRFTLSNLGNLQAAFITLLGDPKIKHLSRESCCLGLSALRGLASFSELNGDSSLDADDLNGRLLKAFGQSTSFGGSAYQETNEQAESRRAAEQNDVNSNQETRVDLEQFGMETGGAAGLAEAALGAYREMAGAALSINRPDILYALLTLSISHTAWFVGDNRGKYNATNLLGDSNAFGDKSNGMELRKALRPHLGKLLPRILRACNDPNKETRDQMGVLWAALTGGGAESREVVSENFLSCVDILIKEASNKLWRARSGALGALSDIIVGRDWAAFGGGPPILNEDDMYDDRPTNSGGVRLLRLWRVVVRAQDDVRDSCRTQGSSLGRALKGVTIRMCDPSIAEKSSGEVFSTEEKSQWARDAASVTATSLRWLVKGLSQTVPETQGLCISTLAELIRVARPSIIEASLPDVLRSLLLAISGLEPSAFNYLQLRTENQDNLERARLQLAQNGPLSEAITRCLELLPKAKPEIQHRVVSELDVALRLSVGFATRASVADCATLMCSMCPHAFDFPSATNNPSVRLMRAFYFAAERERGQGSKDKMIHALGTIAALCPGGAVRKLAVRASARYKACIGNNDDPSSRRAAAAALRAIAVRASNQMMDGGASNVWASSVLPVAYLGKRDADKKAASLMKEVWDESSSSIDTSGSGDRKMFGTAIEEQLLTALVGECTSALQDVAWSRRVAGAEALAELCESGILAPMPPPTKVPRKISDHDLERASRRARSSLHAIGECMEVILRPRLWTGKNKVVSAIGKVISKWSSIDGVKDRFHFGWNGESGQCPWNPITLDNDVNDLYLGDQRFVHVQMAIDDDDEEKEEAIDIIMNASDNQNSEQLSNISEAEEDVEVETDLVNKLLIEGKSHRTLSFVGVCRLLLQESLPTDRKSSNELSEEYQPYRTACLNSVRDLLASLPPSQNTVRRPLFLSEEERLLSCLDDKAQMEPVLIAGALSCLAACLWKDFGSSNDMSDTTDPVQLCTMIGDSCGKKQPAWTVRKAGSLALASLVSVCDRSLLRNPRILSICIGQATYAFGDEKFWRVRESGLRLVGAMIRRTGSSAERDALLLEAMLPHKEDLFLLLRKGLVDTEPAVSALSSELIPLISWWP